MLRVGVSGHRPNRLGGYVWESQFNHSIRRFIRDFLIEILENTTESYTVVTGMDLGFDQFVADVAIKLKEKYKGRLFVEAAIPFRNQPDIWNSEQRERYYKLLESVDALYYVDTLVGYDDPVVYCGEFSIRKLFNRNMYIVDTMDKGLALYNGYSEGGTSHFVAYAKNLGKQVIVREPNNI